MVSENLEQSKQADNPQDMLHSMRKSIDAIIQWSDELRKDRDSDYGREMSLVHTKLQEAKMWTGKCLETIGSPFPEKLRDEAK